jgi:SAM-dependent methyltransferase
VTNTKHKLARARTRLLKQLAHGFARGVFAPVGGDEEQTEVIEGPGNQPLDEAELASLYEQAVDAASRGLVKHTWILTTGDQLSVDARHGFVKKRKHDPKRIDKVMGGKDRPLRPDNSARLLRALGIMKADGSIPAKKAKKYKQVNHLVKLARPTLEHLSNNAPLRIVDLACGNAYLSFVLAEVLRLEAREFSLLGVDRREELIARCRARAAELEWPQLRFEAGDIEELAGEELANADLLLALHACDTASDAAILAGLRAGVRAMWIVPCCHAQLAAQLADATSPGLPYPALQGEGLLRRAHAESLTDALRVEVLRACGYEVSLVEFVGSEHTPKNLLIRAHRRRASRGEEPAWEDPRARKAIEKLRDSSKRMGLEPALLSGLPDLR